MCSLINTNMAGALRIICVSIINLQQGEHVFSLIFFTGSVMIANKLQSVPTSVKLVVYFYIGYLIIRKVNFDTTPPPPLSPATSEHTRLN